MRDTWIRWVDFLRLVFVHSHISHFFLEKDNLTTSKTTREFLAGEYRNANENKKSDNVIISRSSNKERKKNRQCECRLSVPPKTPSRNHERRTDKLPGSISGRTGPTIGSATLYFQEEEKRKQHAGDDADDKFHICFQAMESCGYDIPTDIREESTLPPWIIVLSVAGPIILLLITFGKYLYTTISFRHSMIDLRTVKQCYVPYMMVTQDELQNGRNSSSRRSHHRGEAKVMKKKGKYLDLEAANSSATTTITVGLNHQEQQDDDNFHQVLPFSPMDDNNRQKVLQRALTGIEYVTATIPKDIEDEPQMVLLKNDIIQISVQRQDGWAFGTKIFHANERIAQQLAVLATRNSNNYHDDEDDDDDDDDTSKNNDMMMNVFTDSGWFPIQKMISWRPTIIELVPFMKENNFSSTKLLNLPDHWSASPSKQEASSTSSSTAATTSATSHVVNVESNEYNMVHEKFIATMDDVRDLSVIKIERIENPIVWQNYVLQQHHQGIRNESIEVSSLCLLRSWFCCRSSVMKKTTTSTNENPEDDGSCHERDEEDKQKGLDMKSEQRWLWHGVLDEDTKNKICQQGMNRTFCGSTSTTTTETQTTPMTTTTTRTSSSSSGKPMNGPTTTYGEGIYFFTNASRARRVQQQRQRRRQNYVTYDFNNDNGRRTKTITNDSYRYMMACRVAVGEYCTGRPNGTAPDLKHVGTESTYDTTVDSIKEPSIYVTYHDSQSYPEYAITYQIHNNIEVCQSASTSSSEDDTSNSHTSSTEFVRVTTAATSMTSSTSTSRSSNDKNNNALHINYENDAYGDAHSYGP